MKIKFCKKPAKPTKMKPTSISSCRPLVLGLVVSGLFFGFSQAAPSEVREVCLREKFNVTCPPHHVVNVRVARFGRLKIGRCVLKNIAMGCYELVSDGLVRMCSGRQRCSVDVLTTFARLSPCPEMESYLEVEYECLAVTEVTPSQCRAYGQPSHPISHSRGIISAHFLQQVAKLQTKPRAIGLDTPLVRVSEDRGTSCTVELVASPGMRWNLSLVNFLAPSTANGIPFSPMPERGPKDRRRRATNDVSDNTCRTLLIIREVPEASGRRDKSTLEKATKDHKSGENNVAVPKNGGPSNMEEALVTTCDIWVREKVVYVSDGHRVNIEFLFPDHHHHSQRSSASSSSSSSSLNADYQDSTSYLLKYQVVGCSDPEVINGSFERVGRTEVKVTCHPGREQHRLTCVGDQRWEPTGRIVCAGGASDPNSWTRFSPDLSTFHGVAFILVLGVSLGVVVGCSLLAVTVCFYKRRTSRPQSMATTTTSAGHTTYAPFFYQQQQQQQQQQDYDKMRTYDQQRQLLQQHQQQHHHQQQQQQQQQQQESQFRDNFQVDFKSPKNIRRVQPGSVQTPLLSQTLSQKMMTTNNTSNNNNNTVVDTTAASTHPTLLLHQSLAQSANPSASSTSTALDITPLLISDSMPSGECFHHHHHHHHRHHLLQQPRSGYPGVQFNPDLYGEDSLERALTHHHHHHHQQQQPASCSDASLIPQLVSGGDKHPRKVLDSFPSQSDHIYEIAG